MPPEIVSGVSLPARVQKSAKTKGYRPTGTRTRSPGYRRLPVLFAPVIPAIALIAGSLRYRFVSARTRSPGFGRSKGRAAGAIAPQPGGCGSADRSGRTGARTGGLLADR
jgi:hypothetical protein